MGTVGDCYDNAMIESFWHTLQLELLDTRTWKSREELANAIFEWIECWYNPHRRHSSIGMHSPVTFEQLYLVPKVVVIAGGATKFDAIHSVLEWQSMGWKQPIVHDLCTDRETALRLLEAKRTTRR